MRLIVPIVLTAFFVMIALGLLAMAGYWSQFERAGEQPIPFPHDFHAGSGPVVLPSGKEANGLGLACTKCHVYVDKSKRATVPAMKICMDCHQNIQSESPYLADLKEYWKNKKPIPWARIHKLPQFVYFSHERHIKAEVDCAVCHGDMTVVKKAKQVRTLQMGFCVSCHRANNAPEDCWTCHQ
ncbi:MAG: hypothetical protein GWN00_32560 [Aliifodinibius sp.]|nr:cytochrome c3 family protein [Fodinibius sp.]NIV15504.1 hypothetical protein [Fodinibius sp.]NIY29350.1 hypothetical protein [Fodinibius sp.]